MTLMTETAAAKPPEATSKGNYTVIWFPVRPDHPVLAAAGFTETSQVPVFLSGEAFRRFEKTRTADVTPKALLLGAVACADDDVPGADTRPFLEHLPAMLDVLARGFGAASADELVVDVACLLREQHGSALAHRALKGMVKTNPSFQLARSDLLVGTFFAALDAEGPERRALAMELLELFGALVRDRLSPGPRAVTCYAVVAATLLLRGAEAARRKLEELGAELDAGDEGELRVKLEAFLDQGESGWAGLRFTVT
jgi:hypothetical protein